MKVGTLVRILQDIFPILEREGVIDENDDFHEPSPEKWAVLAGEIETVLKAHGLIVQENVDKIINGLPFILAMAGVK